MSWTPLDASTPQSKDLQARQQQTGRAEPTRHNVLDGDSWDTPSRKLPDSHLDSGDSERRLMKTSDRLNMTDSKLSKRESLKEKKRSYRSQKKEVAREIMSSACDRSVVLMSDWLKVRGKLKGWTKLWCVCKPAMLIIYKSDKMKTWVGTILLNTCQLLQRPSKKEGYCFKLFHPLDQSIWATKGPRGETMGAFVQPLPVSYAIFRAPSENQGKCWMDGLELALRCTSLIKRTTSRTSDITMDLSLALASDLTSALAADLTTTDHQAGQVDDSEEVEEQPEHFSDDDDHSSLGMSESDFELAKEDRPQSVPRVEETVYVCTEVEELGQQGDACQTEEVNDENKSLIWTLVKQVRPGMDLSKVVLPTFILEPRSFLEKLTDYYYHADLLSQAVQQETALERMKMVVKWYLSGFYKKPKGLKKPYNPIIGETYRCYWHHPQSNSRTFYVAEQISHHPPISAFHVTNRHDGFHINGCILAKSKFYGNSISAILEGVATLTFLERGEDYLITMPYAHCKGILLGTLTMEMGGKVTLECPKTGYHCELDFKLKPFFGNGESANRITGCIRMGTEVLCTFEGHWDQQIYIKEITNRERVVFWDPTQDVRAHRLKKFTVPVHLQRDNESEKLWQRVSLAIVEQDIHTATAEKHRLEERQRTEAKERHKNQLDWLPKCFTRDPSNSNKWIYKHADARPWDSMTDCIQYEKDYVIQTQTVHQVPQVWQSPAPPVHTRLPSYHNHMVTDDSCSSDNNTAEVDNFRYHNTSSCPSSRRSRVTTSPGVTHQRDNSDTTTDSSVPGCFSTTRKTSHRNQPDEEFNSNMSAHTLSEECPEADSKYSQSNLRKSEEQVKGSHQHSQSSKLGNVGTTGLDPRAARSLETVGPRRWDNSSRDQQTLLMLAEMQHEMHLLLSDLVAKVSSVQKLQVQLVQSRQSPAAAARSHRGLFVFKEWVFVAVILVLQTLLQWFFSA